MGKLETGKILTVLDELKNVKQVKKASTTYGVYDLVIEAQLETIEELDSLVFNVVRKVPSIKDTNTLIVSKSTDFS